MVLLSDMGFVVAVILGVVCSRARWSHAEFTHFLYLLVIAPYLVFLIFKALFKC